MFHNNQKRTMRLSFAEGIFAKRSIAGKFAAVLIGFTALGIGGCGDDEVVTPDPNAGKKAPLLLLHANPGFSNPVVFYDGTTLIANVAYGAPSQQAVQIGSRTINVKATDGTQLTSASNLQIDSMHTAWVIHTGSANDSKTIANSTLRDTAAMRTALNSGMALVRLINASKTVGKVALRVGSSLGSKVADNLDFQGVSSYTAIDTTNHKLIFTKETGTDTIAVNPVTVNVEAGKTYSVVIFGSADPAAVDPNKLNAIIVTEP
jgi:hypothetical protein